jgi:hypothetical protein
LSSESPDVGGAVAEKFQRGVVIDDVAAMRQFYRGFSDLYDSIVVWTNFDSDLDGAFAFEVSTQNEVLGIGGEIFNDTAIWGSAGRLESYVFMGNIDRYPPSPDQKVFEAGGRPTTLGLLAHEFGHRWLTRVRFIAEGAPSQELLGRQGAHWSFFMDSDASFLEGNDIEDEGDGRFRTVLTVSQYSRLDLYLMGFARPEEVAPFFIVRNGSGTSNLLPQPITNESPPQVNVTITGERRNVRLDDIIQVEGNRLPDFQSAPKDFRQAWVILHRRGDPPTSGVIGQVDTVRTAWESFFQRMTLGRARVRTTLEQ